MKADTSMASVYTDFQGLGQLRAEARADERDPETLRKVARQFEGIMMQMLMKSMRQASMGGGLLDSEKTMFYRDMYDQQMSIHLGEKGALGIADMIVKQLSGDYGLQYRDRSPADYQGNPQPNRSRRPEPTDAVSASGGNSTEENGKALPPQLPELAANLAMMMSPQQIQALMQQMNAPTQVPVQWPEGEGEAAAVSLLAGGEPLDIKPEYYGPLELPRDITPKQFVQTVWPMAEKAAEALGTTPSVLVAQAALETGWGRHINRAPDGTSSNNLFNIKANNAWSGDTVSVNTTEYIAGRAQKQTASFRSYESLGDAFNDYVNFIKSNPRYAPALQKASDPGAYIEALQDAGYATDPAYANKVKDILQRGMIDSGRQAAQSGKDPLA